MTRSSVTVHWDLTVKQPARGQRLDPQMHPPRTRKQIIEGFKDIVNERLASFKLTKREMLVAQLILKGKTHESIAKEVRIGGPTVSFHVANIYEKAGCHNKAGFFDKVYKGIL